MSTSTAAKKEEEAAAAAAAVTTDLSESSSFLSSSKCVVEQATVAGKKSTTTTSTETTTTMTSPRKPTTTTSSSKNKKDMKKYHALVIDAGSIIRCGGGGTGSSTNNQLNNTAQSYYTTQSVINEILDSKSKETLRNLPFDLVVRDPSPVGCTAISQFAKLTGDYTCLSYTDIQVLGLAYDLEKEACNGDMSHVRTEPKRTLGLGKLEPLDGGGGAEKKKKEREVDGGDDVVVVVTTSATTTNGGDNKKTEVVVVGKNNTVADAGSVVVPAAAAGADGVVLVGNDETNPSSSSPPPSTYTSSWASIAAAKKKNNAAPAGGGAPTATTTTSITTTTTKAGAVALSEEEMSKSFGSMNLIKVPPGTTTTDISFGKNNRDTATLGVDGQFSDAEEDDDDTEDEEEEEEVLHQEELEMDFPSLSAACTIPYEGSSDEEEDDDDDDDEDKKEDDNDGEEEEERDATKQQQKQQQKKKKKYYYNSLGKYGSLASPKGVVIGTTGGVRSSSSTSSSSAMRTTMVDNNKGREEGGDEDNRNERGSGSRILGGGAAHLMVGSNDNNRNGSNEEGDDDDDDGEGWVTVENLNSIKAMGASALMGRSNIPNPSRGDDNGGRPRGPTMENRCATTTTDFAMQNVLLQMGLHLLSVDGIRVRRVKQYVTRCSACYEIYHGTGIGLNVGGKAKNSMQATSSQLFCAKCGSHALEKIAASIDGKTGRLILHFNRRKKQRNLRGTKYSLPKPGKGNRFEGELLLAEDQLLMGAWNQKVKRGTKHVESLFGSDIASQVGLSDLSKRDDIKVGFGRGKNPNATKFGRERRGKKKKQTDTKACGLRRY